MLRDPIKLLVVVLFGVITVPEVRVAAAVLLPVKVIKSAVVAII